MSVDELPFVDEHAHEISAPADRVWEALVGVVPAALEGRASTLVARLLGCDFASSDGPRPLAAGSSFPGFTVAAAAPPRRLVLEGRHRFSRYRLDFAIDDLGAGRSRLRAGTFAVFPGTHGRAYRALVVGSRGHVVAVRSILAGVARRALAYDRRDRSG